LRKINNLKKKLILLSAVVDILIGAVVVPVKVADEVSLFVGWFKAFDVCIDT
jgi:hypothetical protein